MRRKDDDGQEEENTEKNTRHTAHGRRMELNEPNNTQWGRMPKRGRDRGREREYKAFGYATSLAYERANEMVM